MEDGVHYVGNIKHIDSFFLSLADAGMYYLPFLSYKFKYHGCQICLEEFRHLSFVCQLNCQHVFHYHCLGTWMKEKKKCRRDVNKCPICLEIFKEIFFVPNQMRSRLSCANIWFKIKYKCPCCGGDIAHLMKSNYCHQSSFAQNGTVELKIELETNYDIAQTE
ncbi:hypothetical protein HELRODRAFT_180977 [Helobdella robusta]|uniref:RING-type domain-containing protein n=1 Tax=Helobdella robusta TaxID=6412 RepID=T1FGH4_HELRO|nr:hypothetical protein HELRODRAFT_180977 [Helobdella robusta]ESN93438.1 hypothetical protein HELRODRAFT_180977 [Helobdella robusta]